ncbi:hypothetical protein VTL71DRAFT_11082 [Oculimacula yallundae]|uniref:Uncharacterized protein n=1 Tax=Oculimacula yallundae TaxID=86028 RepID=A0ABR4CX62_9HELO
MSAMATYGKKKRGLLSSFSVLRDSDNIPSKSKKDKTNQRGSLALSTPVFQDSNYNKESPSNHHDDSIEEMASMLLDDTNMDQLRPEGGKRMSQTAASKAMPGYPRTESQDGKSLPQLPQLTFNGDDAWAMRLAPAQTAAGMTNQVEFSEDDAQPANFLNRLSAQTRKSSAPVIPRKSSKRRSGRPKSTAGHSQLHAHSGDRRSIANPSGQTLNAIASSSQPSGQSQPKGTGFVAADINGKIEAMISATKALKPGSEGTVLHGPLAPGKKRHLVGNKVLTKMKTAINDRLGGKGARKRDSMINDRLLDPAVNEVQDFEEDTLASGGAATALELRMNEEPENIYTHWSWSSDHSDDPFSEGPQSSSITRTPTRFENRLRDDSSNGQGSETLLDLPSSSHTPRRREKKIRTSVYDNVFDDFLSSSPLAHSTPRIRLEPTFEEDGTKLLKSVSADSHSLFDIDQMDIDSSPKEKSSSSLEPAKRKDSNVKDYGVRRHSSKRVKKHPSPSKAELEQFERAMIQFLPAGPSQSFAPLDDLFPARASLAPNTALASRDPNKKIQGNKRHGMKLESLKSSGSLPTLSHPQMSVSTFPRQTINSADGARLFMTHNNLADKMDIDELQWDDTMYNIGMKRA